MGPEIDSIKNYPYAKQRKIIDSAYCNGQFSLKVQRIEKKYREIAEKEISDYAETLFVNKVKPFLIENKIDFVAGMGGFYLSDSESGEGIKKEDLPLSLFILLNSYGINGYPLGSCMPDFKYRDYDFKLRGIS